MKNLVNIIDRIEEAPIDTLWYRPQGKHKRELKPYNSWNKYYHAGYRGRVSNKTCYEYIRMFINNSIGKSFDDVFSEFCKKTPQSWQGEFLDWFEKSDWNRLSYWSYHYVDENGLIQEWEREHTKKPIQLPSLDYEIGYFHKYTGKEQVERSKYYWENERYEQRVKRGEMITFESKNQNSFKRLYAELEKKSRKRKRENTKANELKASQLLKVAQIQSDIREAKRLEDE
jgi:hypothetical protein